MEGTQAPGFGAAKYSASGQLCWTNANSSSSPCGTPPSGATAYGYDASGDRLSGGATNTLGWHQESSQLCYSVASGSGTCAAPPSGASTYSYDSTGRRTSETVGFWTGTFTWDQAQTSLLSDGTASFLYGPSGSVPIEQITGSGTGAVADLLISDRLATREVSFGSLDQHLLECSPTRLTTTPTAMPLWAKAKQQNQVG